MCIIDCDSLVQEGTCYANDSWQFNRGAQLETDIISFPSGELNLVNLKQKTEKRGHCACLYFQVKAKYIRRCFIRKLQRP